MHKANSCVVEVMEAKIEKEVEQRRAECVSLRGASRDLNAGCVTKRCSDDHPGSFVSVADELNVVGVHAQAFHKKVEARQVDGAEHREPVQLG